ncbi:MAG: methyltransferase domain-containing protein [Symplocastrum torsivum CPER-KK1]|jgi:predicted SAM-dependent methyltransferase|uniref:Methyltransferase domain-containing protein n=1 Tax=Symplocastrum torsivum CPER-KK1 TaxID=450513 RepID=A0A951UAP0_9CYAN|nr:methyltransferase domain-containing protein [Symplocastrum torsivum CPER-KK1]
MFFSKKALKDFANKTLSDDFLEIAKLLRTPLYHRKERKRISTKNEKVINLLLKEKEPIKLEFGAGENRGLRGWTTIDIYETCDLCLDLSLPLPFPDNCVTQIYSSHFLEHFSYPTPMTGLLAECYRILKPDGIFSVAVPNARIYLNAYFNPENFNPEEYCICRRALHENSKMDYVNYMAYMDGEHYYMFDEENLLVILANAGFKNVRLREFDPTLDLEERRYESIYAQGEKKA